MNFEDVYAAHYEQVYLRALSLTGHTQTAEDMTQDTFLKAWRAWPPPDTSTLHSWLYTIVTRLAYDLYRHNAICPTQELTDAIVQQQTGYEPISGLVEQWARVEALNSLDTVKRGILVCKATGDSVEAIATRFGLSKATTYTYVQHAQKSVRQRYKEMTA